MVEVAKLTTCVDRLIKDVEDQGGKIEDFTKTLSYLKGWLTCATAVTVLIFAIMAFVIDKSWDSIAQRIENQKVYISVPSQQGEQSMQVPPPQQNP